MLFQFGEDERIDASARPCSVPCLRRRHLPRRLERPKLPPLHDVNGVRNCRIALLGNGRAPPDPFDQDSDFALGQPILRRHVQRLMLIANSLNEQAIDRITGHDSPAALASAEDAGSAVEPQSAALLFGPGRMAGVAALDKERTDLRLEEPVVRDSERTRCSRAAALAALTQQVALTRKTANDLIPILAGDLNQSLSHCL